MPVGAAVEGFDFALLVAERLDYADTVQDILQEKPDVIAEHPVLAVAVLHGGPELPHHPDHERDRDEHEHGHDRVDDEQEDEREDEGGRLREQGGQLSGHERLHGVDVSRDASHQVAGGLVGDGGDGQGGDLFIEQGPHHEGELVAGDGGQTALDHAEDPLDQIDGEDGQEDEQEGAGVLVFEERSRKEESALRMSAMKRSNRGFPG